MLLCGQLRLRAPVAPLRVLPPVLQAPLAPGELARARALAVLAAALSSQLS